MKASAKEILTRAAVTVLLAPTAMLALLLNTGVAERLGVVGAAAVCTALAALIFFACLYPMRRRIFARTLALAFVFALFRVVGSAADPVKYDPFSVIVHSLFNYRTPVVLIGWTIILYCVCALCARLTLEYSVVGERSPRLRPAALFAVCFGVIVLCWLPYYIASYPAVITQDSVWILRQAFGADKLYNHHPVVYTLFVGAFCRAGEFVFGSRNAGVALTAFVQMLGMAAAFAYTIAFLAERRVRTPLLALTLAFFALFPMNGCYAVTIWKDVPFGALMLLFSLSLIRLIEERRNPGLRSMISPCVLCFFVSLLRNNALYIMPLLVVYLIIVFKRSRLLLASSFCAVIAAVLIINNVIYPLCGVEKSASTEYIAVPLQQTARIITNGAELSEDDSALLEGFIPSAFIKEKYAPTIVDPVKFESGTRFGASYDPRYFDEHKGELARLWLQLISEHPAGAADAYVCLTLGYWYPALYKTVSVGVVESATEIGVSFDGRGSAALGSYLGLWTDTPIVNRAWNIGMWVWIMLFLALISVTKKKAAALLPFIPALGLWLTLLVASPVFAENRYMYSVFVMLPVMLAAKDIIPLPSCEQPPINTVA